MRRRERRARSTRCCFPDRPEQRFLELLPAVERFFPPAAGHQVVGLLAEIEWRAETGTKFGVFRLALLGELEKLQFAPLRHGATRLSHESRIRTSCKRARVGRKRLLRPSRPSWRASRLTLTEALLFERVHLTGGAALLIRWGDTTSSRSRSAAFIRRSCPSSREGLREPPRLGAYWKPHRFVELSIKAYFALTSTSLQFGYSAHVEAGASWGGFRADTDFNFLVMTAPRRAVRAGPLVPRDRVPVRVRSDQRVAERSDRRPGPLVDRRLRVLGGLRRQTSRRISAPTNGANPAGSCTQQQEARRVIGDALGDTAQLDGAAQSATGRAACARAATMRWIRAIRSTSGRHASPSASRSRSTTRTG